jgi:hypothetical protein
VLFDGVRWANDWYLPANQRTDYSIEFYEPVNNSFNPEYNDHWNPTAANQVKPHRRPQPGAWGPSTWWTPTR